MKSQYEGRPPKYDVAPDRHGLYAYICWLAAATNVESTVFDTCANNHTHTESTPWPHRRMQIRQKG